MRRPTFEQQGELRDRVWNRTAAETDRDAVFVGPFRVPSEFDDEFRHADVLDDKEGRLAV
jgi:hypothetical protein